MSLMRKLYPLGMARKTRMAREKVLRMRYRVRRLPRPVAPLPVPRQPKEEWYQRKMIWRRSKGWSSNALNT